MHWRAGSPAIQNNAVEQAPAGCTVCRAPDESDERELTGSDFIDRLQRVVGTLTVPGVLSL